MSNCFSLFRGQFQISVKADAHSRLNCLEANSRRCLVREYLLTCILRDEDLRPFSEGRVDGWHRCGFPPLGGQVLPAWFGPCNSPSFLLPPLDSALVCPIPCGGLFSNSQRALDGVGTRSPSSCPPSQGVLGLAHGRYLCANNPRHSSASAHQERRPWAGPSLGVMLCPPQQGPGGGCSALPPHIGRSDAGHRLWPQGHPAQLPGGRGRTVKAMVTEMSIGEEDFQQLQAREGVAITFCLKEFRGLLTFAESANLSLSIHFDVPGRPAIFAIKDSLLDGHFVLATMSESDLRSPERHRLAPPLQADSTPHLDDFANDDIDSYMIAMETTADIEGSRAVPSMSFSPGHQPPSSPGPYSEDNDTEPSIEPGTPPPKKFRSLFFGSVLAPARSPPGPSPVLAEDSEGEG
ncbi:cell cycle checkpoint control protein RAD9A isoform X1 [Panthera uncia]|uniref:cell cycle checkpoint control protein RAD9A isoform X1 n=1 Tax=Panthera uncia TaxID=29064 RepID=UPI0020FFAE05|nr:cell cycle checkpoint control protein RAD9A isoform X1 [Panthera uncia]